MAHENKPDIELGRRKLLGTLGAASLGTVAIGSGHAQSTEDDTYHIVQCGRHLELTPLSGPDPVEAFYDWDAANTQYSSAGTTDLQQPDTTILFLYEGPSGRVSLVIVHGQLGGSQDGGSVTFDFAGLPTSGEWLVQDDFYDAPTNYDNWETDGEQQTVDWTYDGGRTDGGAYGPIGLDSNIVIRPSFNESSALFEQYYEGRIEEWQALSGDRDNPDRFTLEMDDPLLIGQDLGGEVAPGCESGGQTHSIEYGETFDGHLERGDGRDPQYDDLAKPVTFDAEEGESVDITLGSEHFDPYLVLEGPDGSVVGEDDDSGDYLNSQIETTLDQSGEYTIWVGSFSGYGTGSFTLQLAGSSDSGGPGYIGYGETYDGELEPGDGRDPQYQNLAKPVMFDGEDGDRVAISLNSEHFDPYLVLEGPDGSVIGEDDDSGDFFNSRLVTTLDQSGEYTIWAGSYSGRGTGSFTLELAERQGNDDSASIEYNETYNGELESGDGRDPQYDDLAQPVTFHGEYGEWTEITLESDDFDTYLVLEGPDGSIVGEDDDGGHWVNSRLLLTLEQSGEYTVWAGSYSGDRTGSFTLTLS